MSEQARRSELQRRVVQKYQQEGKMIRVAVTDQDVNEAYERAKATFPKRPPAVTFRQLVDRDDCDVSRPSIARRPRRIRSWRRSAAGRTSSRWRAVSRRTRRLREHGGDLGWNRRGRTGAGVRADDVRARAGPGQSCRQDAIRLSHHQGRSLQAVRSEGAPHPDQAGVRADGYGARAARGPTARCSSGAAARCSTRSSKRFHDRDELEGSLEPFPKEQLPESYRTAIGTQPKGDFVGPFPIADQNRGVPKFVVLQLTDVIEAGDYTVEEVRDRMRQQLSQERSFRRLLDQLKRETYVRTYPVEPFLARGP